MAGATAGAVRPAGGGNDVLGDGAAEPFLAPITGVGGEDTFLGGGGG